MQKIFVFVLALVFCASAGAVSAQSFDCAKAASRNEKLICSDPDLGHLDLELAATIKRALSATPSEREYLLTGERHWVWLRDRHCSNSQGGAKDEDLACLRQAYRDRITVVNEKIASEPVDKTLCQRVVDLYRSVLEANPKAAKVQGNSQFLASPFDVLLAAKTSGVSSAEPREFSDGAPEKIAAWARLEKPAFEFPPDLLEAIAADHNWILRVDRLPGGNFFAAYRIEGTGYCYHSDYFVVREGRARRASGPPAWHEDSGYGCGVDRFFGTIDNNPVAVEIDDKAFTAAFGSSLSVMRWERDHFGPACVVDFDFAPAFNARVHGVMGGSGQEDDACVGSDCNDLQQSALELAEKVQRSPQEARQKALAQLTPQQNAEFAAMMAEFPLETAANEDVADPAHLRDTAPLTIPLVLAGKVCRASIGHTTMGWRTWPDWNVKFECRESGTLRGPNFIIGMGRGRFLNATVK